MSASSSSDSNWLTVLASLAKENPKTAAATGVVAVGATFYTLYKLVTSGGDVSITKDGLKKKTGGRATTKKVEVSGQGSKVTTISEGSNSTAESSDSKVSDGGQVYTRSSTRKLRK